MIHLLPVGDRLEQWIRSVAAVGLRCVAAVLGLAISTGAFAQGNPRVLVDLSHEFTFRFDIFGYSSDYWSATNAIEKTTSFAILNTNVLDIHDVLVTSQSYPTNSFLPGEVEMITAWVASGGGLWIAANRRGVANAFPSSAYPLQPLAGAFGVTFNAATRQGSIVIRTHAVTAGVTNLVLDADPTDNLLSLVSGSWEVLVEDAAGSPVIVARSFGSGRVIISAQDAMISDPFQNPTISNVTLMRNLVRWLAEPRRGNRALAMPFRILPENVVSVGPFEFRYPATVVQTAGVEFVKPNMSAIIEALENSIHKVGLDQTMRFVILAGGGGYRGGAEIGLGSDIPPAGMLQVAAHELTHSFDATSGQHPEWMHGWPSFAAIRTARLPGYGGAFQAEGDLEYQQRVAAFVGYELANGTNPLEITELDRGIGGNAWAIGGKLMRMIEELESLHGADFMPRFYRLKRRYHGRDTAPRDTSEMVRLFSLAAGADVYPFFVTKGSIIPVRKTLCRSCSTPRRPPPTRSLACR